MTEGPDWIRVARVLGVHGVDGEVTVELLGGGRDRWRPGLALRGPGGEVVVESVRGDGRHLICRLGGLSDREQAAALTGAYLEAPGSELRRLPEGEFYHFQLVGLEVRDSGGRRRGRLVDIEAYPAHDIYVVRTPTSLLRVPAVREAVLAIDLAGQRITVAESYLEAWVDAI